MNVGCVLLAAGAGKRFGGEKLLYEVNGISLIARALALLSGLPFSARVCVVRAGAERISTLALAAGFHAAANPDADRGVGTSVSTGTLCALERRPDLDGILYAVGDQPYLASASVARLMEAFEREPEAIVSLAYQGERGNPAIFPRALFAELAALDADVGGGAVIRRHPAMLRLVEADAAEELTDLDVRPQDGRDTEEKQ